MRKRLFIAVPVNKNYIKAFADYQKVCITSGQLNGVQVRWTPGQNFHLTISFIGSVEEKYLPVIEEIIAQSAQQIKPFNLEFEIMRRAPTQRLPRLVWAVFKKNEQYNQLVKVISKQLEVYLSRTLKQKIRILEKRAIVPHVTLARLKGRLDRVEGLPIFRQKLRPLSVRCIQLYESKIQPTGSHYQKISEYILKG